MPKQINGKWYVSAGELADYIFCPEHWRLRKIQKIRNPNIENIRISQKEHQDWILTIENLLLINKILRIGIIILSISIMIAYFFGKISL